MPSRSGPLNFVSFVTHGVLCAEHAHVQHISCVSIRLLKVHMLKCHVFHGWPEHLG